MSSTYALDSDWALLVLATEDSYTPGALDPPPDSRITADWDVLGVLTGQDALLLGSLILDANRVMYGFLLRSKSHPSEYAIPIRGTASWAEWAIDAEWVPKTAHPVSGAVETGFYSVARSLKYRSAGSSHEVDAVEAITALIGSGSVTVPGHSLGAAVAQMYAFDLASPSGLGKRVTGKFIASPHPGDATFAWGLAGRLGAGSVGYSSPFDLVTHVPEFFGFSAFPNTVELPRNPDGYKVDFSAAAQHHALVYALRMNPDLDLARFPAIDKPYLDCLRRG